MIPFLIGASALLPTTTPARIPGNGASMFTDRARWIWDGGDPKPVDAYRLFRKTFTLNSMPRKARLRITADAEYRLFINGAYIGRGPAPNPPAHVSVDQFDVPVHLTQGENVIGVIVHHLGVPSFPRMLGRAGLLAELTLDGRTISTDDSWLWHDAWWNFTNERFSPFRGFTEELDAGKEPQGWTTGDHPPRLIAMSLARPRPRIPFDPSGWKPAVVIGPVGCKPWTNPELRDIPPATDCDIFPAGPARPKTVLVAAPIPPDIPPKKQAAKQISDLAVVKPGTIPQVWDPHVHHDSDDPRNLLDGAPFRVNSGQLIVLDFGREVSGYPQISAHSDTAGSVLDIGYGEGFEADGRVSVMRQGNPDSDRLILRQGYQHLRTFHHRAFRYMVIAVRPKGEVSISFPSVVESGYPVRERGSFTCSDTKLAKIWEVGRQTMRICMDQGFMDCPWRERGQYIGDGLAEGPVALYAFGDTTLMRRFLRQGMLCQPADGLLEPAYPSDWTAFHAGRKDANRIPGYGLLWVVMLENYWRETGDDKLVAELRPTLRKLLAWFDPFRGPDGMLRKVPEWNFIDWAGLKPESEMACLNLQYLMALQSATALGENHESQASQLAESFERAHWDVSRGLYRDAPGVYTVHANALALLALSPPFDKAARIIQGIRPQNGAPQPPILGESAARSDLLQPESPYFEGFVLRALCRYGRHDAALRTLIEKWWPMIERGATTFWESFAGQWSQCHAWSCEPTAMLSRDILGASYDAPTRTITFAPRTVNLTWAEGITPLSCGDVKVRWDVKGDTFTTRINTPRGVKVHLDLPAKSGEALAVDGQVVPGEPENGRIRGDIAGGAHSIVVGARHAGSGDHH